MNGVWRRRLAVLAAAGTLVVLAGCGGQESAGPSGSTGGPATSTTSADPSASLEAEKARVIAGYQANERAVIRLFAGGKADPKILQGTATPEAALETARQAYLLFSTGGRMVGTITSTPRSVQITGSTATLITCVDSSRWVGVKAGTTPTPGQTGESPGLAKVQLVRDAQGTWLFKQTEAAGPC